MNAKTLIVRSVFGHQEKVTIPAEHLERFRELDLKMAELLEEIRTQAPEANVFLDGEGRSYLLGGKPTENLPGHQIRIVPEHIAFAGLQWNTPGGYGSSRPRPPARLRRTSPAR